jgi:hypothetical protein
MEDCEQRIVACSHGRLRHTTEGGEDENDTVQAEHTISNPEPAQYEAEC